MRKICVVTGSRADYGLLRWPIEAIRAHPALTLQVIATGMHLSPEFGLTAGDLERDGIAIDARIESLLSSDSGIGVAKAVGLGVIGFADALAWLRPDILMVLGDRFEILAAAQAALFARIPVAHLYGGDVTEGAFDDAIRHAITKMAHLHFVSNPAAAARVGQLGEDPATIYAVGVPSIDAVRRTVLLDRPALEQSLGISLPQRLVLATFHPVTLAAQSSMAQLDALLAALDIAMADQTETGGRLGVVFTLPNADTEGRSLMRRIEAYAADRERVHAFTSLGQQRYLSLMCLAAAVVGNSSSGLYEAPALGVPTVDIGDRQRGRLKATSVISCPPETAAIVQALAQALAWSPQVVACPYGDGRSSERIAEILAQIPDPAALVRKRFHDLPREALP